MQSKSRFGHTRRPLQSTGHGTCRGRRLLATKSSGKAFVRIEVTARCARASRRQAVAVMGQLERESAVRSMRWESVLDPTHATADPFRKSYFFKY